MTFFASMVVAAAAVARVAAAYAVSAADEAFVSDYDDNFDAFVSAAIVVAVAVVVEPVVVDASPDCVEGDNECVFACDAKRKFLRNELPLPPRCSLFLTPNRVF